MMVESSKKNMKVKCNEYFAVYQTILEQIKPVKPKQPLLSLFIFIH